MENRPKRTIKVGDPVRHKTLKCNGTVVDIKNNTLYIQFDQWQTLAYCNPEQVRLLISRKSNTSIWRQPLFNPIP